MALQLEFIIILYLCRRNSIRHKPTLNQSMKKLKKLLLSTALLVPAVAAAQESQGAFTTGQYRNVFVEMGYQPAAVEAKLQDVFNDVFRGPNKV